MVYFLPVVAEDPVLKEVGEVSVLPLQPQPYVVLQHLQTGEKNVTHTREKAGMKVNKQYAFSSILAAPGYFIQYAIFKKKKRRSFMDTKRRYCLKV
jgi:hypothetical protein